MTTEIKFENTINRKSGIANPRQIERVIVGSKFNFNLVYNIEKEAEILQDITDLSTCFKLLALDYLGGGGSRGNGRIVFTNLKVENVDNALDPNVIKQVEDRLVDAGKYGEKIYL